MIYHCFKKLNMSTNYRSITNMCAKRVTYQSKSPTMYLTYYILKIRSTTRNKVVLNKQYKEKLRKDCVMPQNKILQYICHINEQSNLLFRISVFDA